MPSQSGLIFVLAGFAIAAVIAMILRRRAERRELSDQLRTKRLALDVIRSSEQLAAGAAASATSLANLIAGDSRDAVQGLDEAVEGFATASSVLVRLA